MVFDDEPVARTLALNVGVPVFIYGLELVSDIVQLLRLVST